MVPLLSGGYGGGGYASPPPRSASSSSGVTPIVFNFNGDFHGSNRTELNEWAANDLIPKIREEVQRGRIAAGVARD